ncbi:MAG TPA: hypothetical protein VF278_14460 [Pirellulales bacterium]
MARRVIAHGSAALAAQATVHPHSPGMVLIREIFVAAARRTSPIISVLTTGPLGARLLRTPRAVAITWLLIAIIVVVVHTENVAVVTSDIVLTDLTIVGVDTARTRRIMATERIMATTRDLHITATDRIMGTTRTGRVTATDRIMGTTRTGRVMDTERIMGITRTGRIMDTERIMGITRTGPITTIIATAPVTARKAKATVDITPAHTQRGTVRGDRRACSPGSLPIVRFQLASTRI